MCVWMEFDDPVPVSGRVSDLFLAGEPRLLRKRPSEGLPFFSYQSFCLSVFQSFILSVCSLDVLRFLVIFIFYL